MKTYNHLNKEERKLLSRMVEQKHSLRSIAKILNRSPSTISRELGRNLTARYYQPLHAEVLARRRRSTEHYRPRLPSLKLRQTVEALLRLRWSPEIIAGHLARISHRHIISHEAIYQWVYTEARHLIRCLPRHHPFRSFRTIDRSKTMILNRIHVSKRSLKANARKQAGHWEVDLVVGRGRSVLKVAVERKTRFTRLRRIKDKSANSSYLALADIFSNIPQHLRKSVTYDNGTENILHKELNLRFNMQSFFCAPYRPWEKPTVENTNGLIRWFLPKKTNLDNISQSQIQIIEDWLNSRPRKCLKFKSPTEAFLKAGVALTY